MKNYVSGMDATQTVELSTREEDLEAIKQMVASVRHATQNELVEEFLDLFRADAIWTTGGGSDSSVARRSRRSPGRCCPEE